MDVDWREHQRLVRVEDRLVNVVELGSGPPLLFVHGLGGCWQNWLENLPEFARDHRVIALDLPGFGRSQMPAGEISVRAWIARRGSTAGGWPRMPRRSRGARACDASRSRG